MAVFCLEDFKLQIEQLSRKNAYRGIESDLISYFFDKPFEELKSGARLNLSETAPYIKKRIDGSGGYRVYYLLIIKDQNIYLLFIHPKTGPFGSSNITDETKAEIYKEALIAINTNDLYRVTFSNDRKALVFEKMK
ncbi:MAG: hypothetical protein ABI723_01505 [Bacteroidia bacterium]